VSPPRGPADHRRVLAFYLPQFHPIPENDRWWGPGFTEWANVTRARPLFPGHYQPHLPADLGFYDLRVPETRHLQARLAAEHGIDGFVYYHYWFSGRRLLGRPLDEVLRTGEPDFPFCLCWANESWTDTWSGAGGANLVTQSYSAADDRAHLRFLAEAFADPRYLRVGDRPLLLVYRASLLPEPRATADRWREEARRLGMAEPYLARVEAWPQDRGEDPATIGFDANVEFAPLSAPLGPRLPRSRARRALNRALHRPAMRANQVYSYERVVDLALAAAQPAHRRFRGVSPGWDNAARRPGGDARILHGSTPGAYERWLRGVLAQSVAYGPGEHLVFVNAWNEWAEGNHLEPDLRWGRAYLEAHRRALGGPA